MKQSNEISNEMTTYLERQITDFNHFPLIFSERFLSINNQVGSESVNQIVHLIYLILYLWIEKNKQLNDESPQSKLPYCK